MPVPPRPDQRPTTLTHHGDSRVDPYFWLRDRDDPAVLAHLRAENEYLAASLAAIRPLEERIFEEIKSRIEETDISVPVRRGAWWYFERTREGLNYPIACRVPAHAEDEPPTVDAHATLPGEQVILDENVEAAGHDFLSVGVFEVSPDDDWVAVGVDFDGDERHTVTFRPLAGQAAVADELHDVYYGFTWSADSRYVFYTRVDEAMRPWQVWRHRLGSPSAEDVLVFEEPDALFTVSVGRTRDDEVLMIVVASSTTSEIRTRPAHEPIGDFTTLQPRRTGVEYGIEHLIDRRGRRWWLMITNEGATDFALRVRRVDDDGPWREVIAEVAGRRLDGVDAFADHLVISLRDGGVATVRVASIGDDDPFGDDLMDRSWAIDGPDDPSTVGLGANPMHASPSLRVVTTSLVSPREVVDIDVPTRRRVVRKRQVVHGYDPSAYATCRLWVTASDGARIPVSVVGRRDVLVAGDGGEWTVAAPAPMLLYGYGSYEISIDPAFSSLRLSLLDRGVLFAIAHVRGGGEMGRSWYEMGRLAQKPTTFSDFVAVARDVVRRGWTTPDQLAARGGSAGGLLMGAVMNLAPDLFRCVVAEVPFVDALTTMLDATLPLTVGEWEEWGDPDASATTYRIMRHYSPYDNLRDRHEDGSPLVYPHVYATGGLNDSRVGFWEPAKWVARLRDLHPENVAYLKTEMGAGHGGPSGRYDAWRDEAQVLAFVISEIAPDSAPPAA